MSDRRTMAKKGRFALWLLVIFGVLAKRFAAGAARNVIPVKRPETLPDTCTDIMVTSGRVPDNRPPRS